jgi:hypothetical protein
MLLRILLVSSNKPEADGRVKFFVLLSAGGFLLSFAPVISGAQS